MQQIFEVGKLMWDETDTEDENKKINFEARPAMARVQVRPSPRPSAPPKASS